MNQDIKISLSVLVPGTKLESREVSLKNPKTGEEELQIVEVKAPAKQVIKLTREAYDYFIDKTPPKEFNGGNTYWANQMSNLSKIDWHCAQIAKHLGGTVLSVQVLDD